MSDVQPSHQLVTGNTVLGRLEILLNVFVAVVLFALMTLRCVDVAGRYGFNAPVPGASELTGLGLALLIFGALPIITAHSEHVSVSLIELIFGQHHAPSERVIRPVALDDDDVVRGVAQFQGNREIEARRAAAENRCTHEARSSLVEWI